MGVVGVEEGVRVISPLPEPSNMSSALPESLTNLSLVMYSLSSIAPSVFVVIENGRRGPLVSEVSSFPAKPVKCRDFSGK